MGKTKGISADFKNETYDKLRDWIYHEATQLLTDNPNVIITVRVEVEENVEEPRSKWSDYY